MTYAVAFCYRSRLWNVLRHGIVVGTVDAVFGSESWLDWAWFAGHQRPSESTKRRLAAIVWSEVGKV